MTDPSRDPADGTHADGTSANPETETETESETDQPNVDDDPLVRPGETVVDISPDDRDEPEYTTTPEGTANPDEIQSADIAAAVEEAQRRLREQQQDDAGANEREAAAGPTPADADESDADDEPVPAPLPKMADEPTDPDEFFDDTLGDPQRNITEARATGQLADAAADTDAANAPETATATATESETNRDHPNPETMSNNTQPADDRDHDRDRDAEQTQRDPAADHADTYVNPDDVPADETDQRSRRASPDNEPTRDQSPRADAQRATQRRDDAAAQRGQSATRDDQATETGDGALSAEQRASAESVDPITDDDIADVDEAMSGGDGGGVPDPTEIDFEAQDVEGASEDRGEQVYEFNGVYFLLDDVDDKTAESMLTAMQDDELTAEDRFDIIINTVVKKPTNAAGRTQNWKYLHRATLAGQCMEHCGLDDMVDFQQGAAGTQGPNTDA